MKKKTENDKKWYGLKALVEDLKKRKADIAKAAKK